MLEIIFECINKFSLFEEVIFYYHFRASQEVYLKSDWCLVNRPISSGAKETKPCDTSEAFIFTFLDFPI